MKCFRTNGIPSFFTFLGWLGTKFRVHSVQRSRWNSDGMNKNFRLFPVPQNNIFGTWKPWSWHCPPAPSNPPPPLRLPIHLPSPCSPSSLLHGSTTQCFVASFPANFKFSLGAITQRPSKWCGGAGGGGGVKVVSLERFTEPFTKFNIRWSLLVTVPTLTWIKSWLYNVYVCVYTVSSTLTESTHKFRPFFDYLFRIIICIILSNFEWLFNLRRKFP